MHKWTHIQQWEHESVMECKSEMWGTCELCSLRLLKVCLDELKAIQNQQLHA